MSNYDAMQRLLNGRDQIIVREPWFNGVVEHSQFIECPINVMGTDGRDVYYGSGFVKRWDAYIDAIVLHEYLHCLCDHIGRRGDRDPEVWNIAADYEINPLVAKLFPTLPMGIFLLDRRFAGMSVESIFDALGGKRGESIIATHWPGPKTHLGHINLPDDLSGEPLEKARAEWRAAIAAAGEPPAYLKAAIEEAN
jgi:hypothetical protein